MSRDEKSSKRKWTEKQIGGRSKKSVSGETPIKKQASAGKDKKEGIRLNKYIANSGVSSRRDADIYIAAGNVTVNGKTVTEMGYRVKPGDEVKFDGRRLNMEKPEYILLNKPKGFFTTGSIEKGSRTVMDLVANATKSKIVPVGKLDRQASGLLLFTNDGTLEKQLAKPKNGIRQIYQVGLNKALSHEDLLKIREGITLEDGKVNVQEISYLENKPKHDIGLETNSVKHHVVQRLFKSLGYEVENLDRVVYGGLTKKDLPRGNWRVLNKQEVINLKNL